MSRNFIDISSHQSSIRIRDVPTDAVIVKATEGRGWRDKSMPGFVSQARAESKPLGFYHYVSQGNTPHAEADNLLTYTQNHRRDNDLLVLDWEPIGSNPGTRNVDWARRFLEHLTGRAGNPVWTYMNLSTANASDWKPVTSRWPLLWLAHYPGNNTAQGYRPAGSRGTVQPRNEWQLAAWQFTDGGRLPGFGANLDLNELYMPWWENVPAGSGANPVVVKVPEIPPIRENDPSVTFGDAVGRIYVDSRGNPRKGCVCMQLTMPLINAEMLRRGLILDRIDVFQGGYNAGGVAASAGTHDRGGVIDVAQGITLEQRKVWADFGVMMFPRTRQYGWTTGDHGHGVWHGCVHRTASAARQVTSGMNGRDGLVGNAVRNFEAPKRTWQDAYREYARQTVTTAPPPIEEDPVPDFNRTVTELDHPGQTDPNDFDTGWRLPADDATVVPPSGKRLKIDANAIIHVPEGIQLTTRWVSWSGRPDPGWVRGANRRHESNQAETVHKGEQAWAGADLRLDVHVDKPCKVWIEQAAWTWELDD